MSAPMEHPLTEAWSQPKVRQGPPLPGTGRHAGSARWCLTLPLYPKKGRYWEQPLAGMGASHRIAERGSEGAHTSTGDRVSREAREETALSKRTPLA